MPRALRADGQRPPTCAGYVSAVFSVTRTHGQHLPVDDGYSLTIRTVPVREDFVVHAGVLKTFDDSEGRARKNRLHVTCRGLIIYRGRRVARRRTRRVQGLRVQEADAECDDGWL